MAIAKKGRPLNIGDVLVALGLLITLVLIVFLFIQATGSYGNSTEAWAIIAMFVMSLAFLGTVAAYGLSFLWNKSLVAVAAFSGLMLAQVCFRIFPLGSAARGIDLLWLMAGMAMLLGAELCRRGILEVKTDAAKPEERSPEARLRQLKQLHDTGLLSDAEYAEGRKQALTALGA